MVLRARKDTAINTKYFYKLPLSNYEDIIIYQV